MFFPERIRFIRKSDHVLEIGPGAYPYPRANVYLDKKFSPEEQLAQFGEATRKRELESLVYYTGNTFPFADKEFDYVICSHVLEHVAPQDLPTFIGELTRIANRGYIEVPNVFYEYLCNTPVHLWLIGNHGDKLHFCLKKQDNNVLLNTMRHCFYHTDLALPFLFSRYRELFFIGFEWIESIDYSIDEGTDNLFGLSELQRFQRPMINPDNWTTESLPPAGVLLSMIKAKLIGGLKKHFRFTR
ncbi:methylase involved in ubiquinone/menaquinone biosynthesis [Desulfocurvibacter africanus PCS]|uniref:Methylase involved in ubiquinone/menaquinone biosynthesis n=1 Tax=Desulfocurvibacter africanus PCS TaxID=1262666 RepID=M5PVR4_DESAF|nr:class I SAM-dependent methyltransferase [Desulfocurvibacter africanus]EMG38427.1 methylase involved in ubiquinone/menaquinone biosynthesis [Desulfocurvibacter africanus PCS]